MSKIRSIEDIRYQLAALAAFAAIKHPRGNLDLEAAENRIWEEVLEAIVEDRFVAPNEAARLALTSRQIKFDRHCT